MHRALWILALLFRQSELTALRRYNTNRWLFPPQPAIFPAACTEIDFPARYAA